MKNKVSRTISIDTLPSSIQEVIARIIAVTQPKSLILFGSRAKGIQRPNSDFDLCVIGKSCTEFEWTQLLVDLIEEPWTLYPVDLIEFEYAPQALQQEIKQYGRSLYESHSKS